MALLHIFLPPPVHSLLSSASSVFKFIFLHQENKKKTCHKPDTSHPLTLVDKMLFKEALWNIIPNTKSPSERLHPCSVLTHVLRTCQQQEPSHGVKSVRK